MKLTMVVLVATLLAGVNLARADQLQVGAGTTYALGSGKTQLNCGTLGVAGTLRGQTGIAAGLGSVQIQGGLLAGDAATFILSGTWNNQGTFEPGTSTVQMNTSCTTTLQIQGQNSFCVLEVDAPAGGTLYMPDGTTTVTCRLSLRGGTAPLNVVSSSGFARVCGPDGRIQLTNVTVNGQAASVSDCVPPIPVAGPWVLALLGLILAGLGGGLLRRRID